MNAIRFRRFLSTISSFQPQLSASFERPTPVVFLSGEFLNKNIWDHWISLFTLEGYSGLSVEVPMCQSTVLNSQESFIENQTKRVQNIIKSHGLTPPVLICHASSTYIGQSMLESHPLSGLVLINPLPTIGEASRLVFRRYISKCLEHYSPLKNEEHSNEVLLQLLRDSYSIGSSLHEGHLAPIESRRASLNFLQNLKEDDIITTYQPGMTPVQLLFTRSHLLPPPPLKYPNIVDDESVSSSLSSSSSSPSFHLNPSELISLLHHYSLLPPSSSSSSLNPPLDNLISLLSSMSPLKLDPSSSVDPSLSSSSSSSSSLPPTDSHSLFDQDLSYSDSLYYLGSCSSHLPMIPSSPSLSPSHSSSSSSSLSSPSIDSLDTIGARLALEWLDKRF